MGGLTAQQRICHGMRCGGWWREEEDVDEGNGHECVDGGIGGWCCHGVEVGVGILLKSVGV